MRDARKLLTAMALGVALVVSALPAAAQTGRVGGTVKDQQGQPIKGATVVAENPGLVALVIHRHDGRPGPLLDHRPPLRQWKITASAPGSRPAAARERPHDWRAESSG